MYAHFHHQELTTEQRLKLSSTAIDAVIKGGHWGSYLPTMGGGRDRRWIVCVCVGVRVRVRACACTSARRWLCVCVWGFRSLIQVELEHVDELNQGLNSHVLLLLFQVQKCSGNLNLEILFGPKKSEPYFVFGAGSVNPSEVSAEVS